MQRSPPSRWCGLKSVTLLNVLRAIPVTTFAVVWIEIKLLKGYHVLTFVTTFAVVWIEIKRVNG